MPTGRRPRLPVTAHRYSPVYLPPCPLQYRGKLSYCAGRPCELDQHGNIHRSPYGQRWNGKTCTCHGVLLDNHEYWIRPENWATTPAEGDVDPHRPRRVRFAGSKVVTTFEPWYNDAWGDFEDVQDPATEADDDLEILALDLNTLSVEASPSSPPPPAKSDFQRTFDKLMAEGFDDDED